MRRTLITGAGGVLGFALCQEFAGAGDEVLGLDRVDRHRLPGVSFAAVDLCDTETTAKIVTDMRPQAIIHGAAMTSHADCEAAPDVARQLHVEASGNLARLALNLGARFIHISTEAVYGGHTGPHREDDPCAPEGVYAVTKREGERAVLSANASALVLRATPVGYAPHGSGRTLAEWMVASLVAGKTVQGFLDVFFTPIAGTQLARLLLSLMDHDMAGVFNCGCADPMSKLEFARGLCSGLGFPAERVQEGRRSMSGSVHHGEMEVARFFQCLERLAPSGASVVQTLVTDIQRMGVIQAP